ncbi:tail protein X [Spartinivicinus marinus]|uniref:tail protein X n=1 Tax=Spartinivicinus marinus TaxID=2994442 RepID=UPI001C5CC043|nr:tail protein X [Spartinivicinus marinus]
MSTTDNSEISTTSDVELPERQQENEQQLQVWREQQEKYAEQARQQGKVVYRTSGGETADWIAWQLFKETRFITESIYEENPGLANFGVYLPENIPIIIPAVELQENNADQVVLWQ